MNLKFYSENIENLHRLSLRTKIPYSVLWRTANKITIPTPGNAVKIEKATGGKVSAKKLVFDSLSTHE